MATYHANAINLFINDVNIGELVRSFTVESHVGELAMIRLELVGMPELTADGTIRICTADFRRTHKPSPPIGGRAVRLREDDHESASPDK